MPLEFTAIDPQAPDWDASVVAIPLQAHEFIMSVAHDRELKLLSRMAEYWEDTVFQNDELESLRLELSQVSDSVSPQQPDAERMADLFTRLGCVITEAQGVGGRVEAIAD